MDILSKLASLSNAELLSSLTAALSKERSLTANIVVYLAEVEDRRVHLEMAYSSMFDFCLRKLNLSEGEAYRRLTASRLGRRFPVVLQALASGKVHLSGLVLLRDVLSENNVDDVLDSASGKSKRQIEELVAKLAPKAPVADSIRKLPQCSPVARPAEQTSVPAGEQLEPLSEGQYRVHFTADKRLHDKLERARGLMSHRQPNGDIGPIIDKALDLLLADLENEMLGKTDHPRDAKPSSNPAYVSRATRRTIVTRDGEQCAYVSPDGERCPSRRFLEVDHRTPKALGGSGDASNTRLLCRAHNRHEAEKVFGRAHIEERIRVSRKKRAAKRTANGTVKRSRAEKNTPR